MKKLLALCLLLLAAELSAQNFQRSYKSGDEDPDLLNMVLLESGNLIASGTYAFQQLQPVLLGLSPDGDLLWQKGMNSSLQGEAFSALKMLPLPNGNALVLFVNLRAVLLPPVFIRAKVLIAEVSALDGSFVWRRYLGDDDFPVVYNDAVLTPDGILLTGYVSNQFSLAKISYQGDLIWQKNYKGPDPLEYYLLDGLTVNNQGEIYAIGGEYGTNAFNVLKFDSEGNPLWSKRYDVAAPNADRIFFEVNIALSADQRPVVYGTNAQPGPVNYRVFILELNPADGQVLLSKGWSSFGQSFYAQDIALLNDNTFLLTMGNGGTGVLAQYVKYDLEDGVIWSIVDDKTNLTGSIHSTLIGPDGYYYNLSQRLTLVPLARTSILTRTDHLLTNKPDCCHQERTLSFANSSFEVSDLPITPAAGYWELRNFTPVFESPTGTVADVCVNAELPELNFSQTDVCTGACVSVTWDQTIAPNVQWQVNDEPPFSSDSVRFCFNAPGVYTIIATSLDNPCARRATQIRVSDLALPGITLLDSVSCPGECLNFRLDSILPGQNYVWTFEGGTPAQFEGTEPPPVCYQQSGAYNARVSVDGCLAAFDTTVSIKYEALEIPNAFTPNGDQANDRFKPIVRCPAISYRLKIYNRWGKLLFETTDPDAGWDGTFEGEPQPSEVYLWTLEITDQRDEGEVMDIERGDVTLLR